MSERLSALQAAEHRLKLARFQLSAAFGLLQIGRAPKTLYKAERALNEVRSAIKSVGGAIRNSHADEERDRKRVERGLNRKYAVTGRPL